MKLFSAVRVARQLGIGLLVVAATFGFAASAQARVLLGSTGPAALTNGLVGYWPLDGSVTIWTSATAGTTVDLSGNGNTGTMANLSKTASPVAGKTGQAIYLNTGTITVASSTSINQLDKMTIAFWIKGNPSTSAWKAIILDQNGDSSRGWAITQSNLTTTIYLRLDTSAGGNQTVGTIPAVLDGKWHHIVYALDTGTSAAYKDGQLITKDTYLHGTGFSGYNYLTMNAGVQYLPSQLDDVREYDRALTAAEVKQLYGIGTANVAHSNTVALSNGLVGYWPLDGSATNWRTNTTADVSGNGYTGRLFNLATSTAPTPGKIGQALKFDGSIYHYIGLGASNKWTFTTASTLSAWVKTTSTSDQAIITFLRGADSTALSIILSVDVNGNPTSTGYPGGRYRNAGAAIANGSTAINDGKWHYLAWVISGTSGILYVDGISSATVTDVNDTNTFALTSDSAAIGVYPGTSISLLTAGEVKQLYKLGTANVAHSNTVALSNGLVGYWPLDGSATNWRTNTTADVSGNGYTGWLFNLATTTSPVAGKLGQALNFNGWSSVIDMGDVLHPTGAFTYSVWIYVTECDTAGSSPTIMGKFHDSTANSETWFGFNSGNCSALEIEVISSSGNWMGRRYNGSLSMNQWYHVVTTFDGGSAAASLKIYVDGVQVDNANNGAGTFTSIASTNAEFVIGMTDAPNFPFAGRIDDVRVYNRALTATEVLQLYHMGQP